MSRDTFWFWDPYTAKHPYLRLALCGGIGLSIGFGCVWLVTALPPLAGVFLTVAVVCYVAGVLISTWLWLRRETRRQAEMERMWPELMARLAEKNK